MIYFKDEGKIRKKYEISLDKAALERIKIEIINNCSRIKHHDYETTKTPNYFDYLKIRNYKEEEIGIRESRDFYSSDETLYHVIYDEYEYPYLVEIIDKLLNGEVNAIDEILNPNFEKEPICIDEEIASLKQEIETIFLDNKNINKKIDKLNELKLLYEQKKLNENQISVIEYYTKVKEMISFKLVDYMEIDLINKVNKFNCGFESKKYIKTK